jgi:hypothetical protein
MYAFWFGFPGSINRNVTPFRWAQVNIALPVNSAPLSSGLRGTTVL